MLSKCRKHSKIAMKKTSVVPPYTVCTLFYKNVLFIAEGVCQTLPLVMKFIMKELVYKDNMVKHIKESNDT